MLKSGARLDRERLTTRMSFLLRCPNCGDRDVSEFRYGGQLLPAHWAKEPFRMASNLPIAQRERWYHRFGCRQWLVAERVVGTNEVLSTTSLDAHSAAAGGDEMP
jgi:heterotetrameric sarcosine oxidase delta subunit